MIIGLGTDIVDVRRIEKILNDKEDRFAEKYFTQEERDLAESRRKSGQFALTFAKRWAAKEACAKAFGTGFQDGLSLSDISVFSNQEGKPEINLSDQAKSKLHKLIPSGAEPHIHLSLSDDPPMAMATVIIEAI